ncbi:inosamine-phosphate amidinotransferase 1 [Bdellovibrio sp. HCB2-146]|uniref:inosamine-phosphate amidinotransferase 1 n=1 Tax=Bdellovibrio sp. HCB2-146 TaxID=3394362 RepID=UPI0039BC83A0
MLKINSWDEWSPLKTVIVGRADGARVPREDRSLRSISFANYRADQPLPSGPYPQVVIDEANEDLEIFSDELRKLGIQVLRPHPVDTGLEHGNSHWQSDSQYIYCPRDSMLVVGNTVLASPMPIRARAIEHRFFTPLLQDFEHDFISPPLVERRDSSYQLQNIQPGVPTLRNEEILFDAANILRCGYDLFYLVSNSGNKMGAEWLQKILGNQFRVHPLEGIYSYMHIDSTIALLRPGLVLLNPERIHKDRVPEIFKKWQILWSPEPEEFSFYAPYNNASKWIGMNLFMLHPGLAVVESSQTGLIRLLEKNKIDVLPVRMRHQRTLGGGAHCVTLDLVRDGGPNSYF